MQPHIGAAHIISLPYKRNGQAIPGIQWMSPNAVNMPHDRRDGIVKFGRFTLDVRTEELQEGEKRLAIQGKPLELLLTLLEDPGQLVTRETLYERLWPGLSGDCQRGLDTAVKKLRKVLGDAAERPSYIETLPRRGYRLLTPVSVTASSHQFHRETEHQHLSAPIPPKITDPEAERLYLEGYHCWNKRTPPGLRQALAYFMRARALDPTNSDYHAALAQTHLMRAWHGLDRPIDAIGDAKSSAVAALLLDRAQVHAHIVLAWARGGFDYDLKGALADLHAAIQLAPDHPWGYIPLSIFSMAAGDSEQSDEAMQKAREIDPVSPTIYAAHGYALYMSGRFEEAEKAGRGSVDRDPEFGLAHFYYGLELTAVGRLDDAIRQLAMADLLMLECQEVRAAIGLAMVMNGELAEAAGIDQRLEETAAIQYVDAYHRALLKDALGFRDTAIALLEEACNDHSHWFCLAAVDPKLKALRLDPRVQNLIRRIRM
jgi:DNA-binding winged helix-turn-helix (wHTH) protein